MSVRRAVLEDPVVSFDDTGFTVLFGRIDSPAAVLAHERDHLPGGGLSQRAAIVRKGDGALRLNSPGWLNLRPQSASDLKSHDDRKRFCRRALERATPLFSRPLDAFLAFYLDFVDGEIERQRDVLERRLVQAGFDPAGDFPTCRDWFFSAFLPLPNAHLATRGNFVRFDAVFWTGTRLVAVLIDGVTMITPRRLRDIEELQAENNVLQVIRIKPADVQSLRGHFGDFTDGCRIPFGPFRNAELGRL
jgi:hypothetical protein